jgi:hypothetical protein
LVCPDWPWETKYMLRLCGVRQLLVRTRLTRAEDNLRSNTGDDLYRVSAAKDNSCGINPHTKATDFNSAISAMTKAASSNTDKENAEVLKKQAREEAVAEKARLKEEEKERSRVEREREKVLQAALKEQVKKEAEERKTVNAAYIAPGGGAATVRKNALGSKRYQTLQVGGAAAKASRKPGAQARARRSAGMLRCVLEENRGLLPTSLGH